MRLALAFALLALAMAAEESPIAFSLATFIVSEIEGEEELTPAETARPGQIIEYRITALNQGETTLPENTVEIDGPIPEGTYYVEDSATRDEQTLRTEYSVDGSTFSEPPLGADEGEEGAVDPREYTHVRWTVLIPLEPQQEVTVAYRVVME